MDSIQYRVSSAEVE